MSNKENAPEAGSQTLSRGLTALDIIGSAVSPVSVAELAQKLGIHRSMAYRLVKTLEQHGYVEKTPSGSLLLGIKLSTLARGVARTLQEAAAPVLAEIAEELEMTAFLVAYDGEAAVTLRSAEPLHAQTTVAKKPGTRHSIDLGAPGHVIRSQLFPVEYPPQSFEFSKDEVLAGIASIAVPLVVPGNQPAALAVLYLPHEVDMDHIAQVLRAAAERIVAAAG
ncbi:IclR family transcriptional regulator [Aurantimicrobium minutum]|uniref:IclR family transcriptional regulator n=1 Tax=Aurantimicrobium minutum TaxID=708131 RepID=UPI0024749BCE|nr:helix-turn-helix domain-containing protein [Aurantimicrobium minutum]MDH6536097.1 DNA-binding IclR family transcriptional regulator [Aurantimicrobium minutum]